MYVSGSEFHNNLLAMSGIFETTELEFFKLFFTHEFLKQKKMVSKGR